MFGKNKIQKPEIHDGSTLKVTEIFPTFQGEGPFVGHPAVFLRLSGCNLACNFCDTEFDEFEEMQTEKIVEKIESLAKNQDDQRTKNLVVITGGEPMRQPISPLCQELIKRNFQVQIETNGTIFQELPKEVTIICSPKITNGKYHQIRPDLLKRIDALKFIISANKTEYSQIKNVGQTPSTPIYLQPMDEYNKEKNQSNIALTLNLAQKHGHIISLQTHKILKID